MILRSIAVLLLAVCHSCTGCQFYPPGEYLRFVRVPENLKVGEEILSIQVHPRNRLRLQPIDKIEDVQYFTYTDVNRTTISLLLAKTLEDLVDTDHPRNVLKFKISCDYSDGEDVITSSLSVTVYVEDVNDHAPVFVGTPYRITVDELTPVGLTLFRGVRAVDRDKPNTPNSDIQYALVAGNQDGKFALDNSHQAYLTLKKPLDYDTGDREFILTVSASDRGVPPRSANATIRILVMDNDDLSPKFTKGVYRTKISEFYPLNGEIIHKRIDFDPPIFAFDQDVAIDAPIRYDIIAGNERHLFSQDHVNGSIFLEREIDLDSEKALPGNTFVLQIQAAQLDNPLKAGVARVEVEIVDLNDNLPEFEVDFYNISIVENLPNGFSVLQIIAVDQDQGDNADFTYQLDDKTGAFTLDSRSGWLTVREQAVLDREKRSSISMRVYAKEKMPSMVTNKIGSSSVNVEVTLLDANDNNPSFIPNNLYNFMITTDAREGEAVGKVHAVDPDLGRNGLVMYSIQKASNLTIPFNIDSKTGSLYVDHAPLVSGKHLLFVESFDQPLNPSERRSALAVVSVDVKAPSSNYNNHGLPDFIGAPYEFWVGGNVGIGTSIGQIRVTNIPNPRELMYDLLHGYHEGVPFAVEERSGTITVVDELTKFKREHFDFEGVVTNDKDVYIVTNVTVHVVDPRDEKTILMKASSAPIEFHVKENQPNVLIGKLGFKNTTTTSLKFSIANQKDVTDHISITSDGTLFTIKALDREIRDVYRLTVIAEFTKGHASGTGIYQVTIFVDDENDNEPKFERSRYEGRITENSVSGTEVDLDYLIHVNDKDIGDNGQFTVSMFGNGSEMFSLDKNSGKVYFISADTPLDREDSESFNLLLVAKDKGGMSSEAKLNIRVEDENDNAPLIYQLYVYKEVGIQVLQFDMMGNRVGHFERAGNGSEGVFVLTQAYQRAKRPKEKSSPLITVPEDVNIGSSIVKLIAQDVDAPENAIIKFEIVSEMKSSNDKNAEPINSMQYFTINSVSGEVGVAKSLIPETEFRLNVSASDKAGLKDHILLRLMVQDINDHPPVFKKSWYTFDIEESTYYRRVLGTIEALDADFGSNANISYMIDTKDETDDLPFSISSSTGVLSINGQLDRETQDRYRFSVIAKDNPKKGKSLSSSVFVEVNVLDVNDNPPTFYGYDDILKSSKTSKNDVDVQDRIPIYYATIAENSPIGTPVTRVFANDSDFTGNGNGLLLFDIPFVKNKSNLFTVDSKQGVVTTIGKLDYETDKVHNITIIASDLGSPSLSSTALLVVKVIDVPEDLRLFEKPVFAHRYYEIEVEENVPVPMKLLTLNVTDFYKNYKFRYSIVGEKNDDNKKIFKIDPRNGTLFVVMSPDREKKSRYELIIKLEEFKIRRDMTVMVYPVSSDRLGKLGLNEVKVIVRVTDVNDNPPKFTTMGRPIIAAIPASANYGFHILRLQARDPDLGLNGEVRYQILGRAGESSRRFAIDPVTGQVRSISSFIKDAGKVFGFDVKATDRRGADDGKSSIANVFVYILDEQNQLVLVMGLKPVEVERSIDNITSALYNVTGYDIRIRKLEPHSERNQLEASATDMYLYAVDPLLNSVVDMNDLQQVLQTRHEELERSLNGPKVLAIASGPIQRSHFRSQRVLLSSLEVGVVILGCVVFIGALATAICVLCVRKKKKKLLQKAFTRPLSYSLAANGIGKPTFFSPTFTEGLCYETDGHRSSHRHGYTSRQHDVSCPRYVPSPDHRGRSRNSGGMKSVASSSGQDSGIVETPQCQCGNLSSHSSEESSYEDSLQSVSAHRRETRNSSMRHSNPTLNENPSHRDRRSRNRSITEAIVRPSGLHRPMSMTHLSGSPAFLVSAPTPAIRKSNERLVLYPVNQ
ncbi:cadherin-89D [Harmonia axyridis]|uniref:cadherin-89D n=1 Tax=Harmonia axyridis TaxID=115357 RepID=UPI001E2756E5|nr:cadherin-89D [Harmonia axyridis]